MIHITTKTVTKGLKSIVKRVGEEFIYERPESGRCVYVDNGVPSCLVGTFLADVGVSIDDLIQGDEYEDFGGMGARQLLSALENQGIITITQHAVRMLDVAQVHQDDERTWAYAAQRAYGYGNLA